MSISSIDISTLAPRSSEASGIVGREQQQMQHIGEQGAANFQRNVEQNTQRTVEANKSEKEYNFDDSESKGGAGGGRKRKKQKEKEAPVAPRSNSSFDITI